MKQEFMCRAISGTVGDIAFTGLFDVDLCGDDMGISSPKMHKWYEINVIRDGEYIFEGLKNNIVGPLRAGDVVLVSPGYYHASKKLGKSTASKYTVRFEIAKTDNPDHGENLYQLLLEELQVLGNGIFPFQLQNGKKYFDEIFECLSCQKPGNLAVAEATFKVFMTELFMKILHLHTERKERNVSAGDGDGVIRRKDVIDEFLYQNYSNSKLTAELLAKHLSVSVRQMNRIVSNIYKMTFYQLLTSVRLESAKKLLLGSDMPIKDVAEKVGYESSTGFFVAFKKKYGVTPGEFCGSKRE